MNRKRGDDTNRGETILKICGTKFFKTNNRFQIAINGRGDSLYGDPLLDHAFQVNMIDLYLGDKNLNIES